MSTQLKSPQWKPAHACGDGFRRAGCGKVRTSGSMRGQRVVLASRAALIYSLPEVARLIGRAARLAEAKFLVGQAS